MKKSIIFIVIVLIVIFGLALYLTPQSTSRTSVASITSGGPEARLIESKGLAEFDPANDIKDTVLPEEKLVYKEVYDALQVGGDLKDSNKIQEALTSLDA